MYRSFEQMERDVQKQGEKKILALAGSHDDDVLAAVVHARKKNIAGAVLIGDVRRTEQLLSEMGERREDYELIECQNERECARLACQLVKDKKADIPMKGLMQTASFMKAILDKESYGFVPEQGLLSQATLLEFEGRMMVITDCAVNISPQYAEKVKILNNAVALAKRIGIAIPKAAVIAPVEMVNPNMPSTIDAAMLSKAAQRGQIKDCIVDGPLAMDNALSKEAARHKGIQSEVAGEADILLVPDLCTGNVLTKALVHFAKGIPSAGLLLGTVVPVVMTSRTDTPENKYHSILASVS